MDIERARTFLEIIHCGSFQGAAQRMNVTQTTISARIRTLEADVGRPLFVRNRTGARLTPAGREFERYAQSMVQLWERARHQLAVPEGKTGIVALGGELSLWNPLLLDWLVWMRKTWRRTGIRAHVGVPDQLIEQLRTGVLDIAVLYAPPLLPGFTVRLVQEEHLVMVRTVAGETGAGAGGAGEPSDYVHVDWGPQFATGSNQPAGVHGEQGLMVGLGPLGLSYILRAGGSGYFRRGAALPHIASGELELVEDAPEFTYPVYAVYAEAGDEREEMQGALQGLAAVVR